MGLALHEVGFLPGRCSRHVLAYKFTFAACTSETTRYVAQTVRATLRLPSDSSGQSTSPPRPARLSIEPCPALTGPQMSVHAGCRQDALVAEIGGEMQRASQSAASTSSKPLGPTTSRLAVQTCGHWIHRPAKVLWSTCTVLQNDVLHDRLIAAPAWIAWVSGSFRCSKGSADMCPSSDSLLSISGNGYPARAQWDIQATCCCHLLV